MCQHTDTNQDDNMTYFMVVVRIKLYFKKFSHSHSKLDSVFVVTDFCSVKADRPGVCKVNTMSLCCACGVINLSGTCNSD